MLPVTVCRHILTVSVTAYNSASLSGSVVTNSQDTCLAIYYCCLEIQSGLAVVIIDMVVITVIFIIIIIISSAG